MEQIEVPQIQLSDQNRAFLPSPAATEAEVSKKLSACLISKLEIGPSSLRVCSNKPEPAHSERHAHQLKVGNVEASQLLGATCVNPGYRTLSARSDLCPAPEQTSNQCSDGLHRPGRDLECHGDMHRDDAKGT
jgi:hypothetical protein